MHSLPNKAASGRQAPLLSVKMRIPLIKALILRTNIEQRPAIQ